MAETDELLVEVDSGRNGSDCDWFILKDLEVDGARYVGEPPLNPFP